MFRYEMRPPSQGKNKQQPSPDRQFAYHGGGPLQRAMKKDLKAIYHDMFLAQVQQMEESLGDKTTVGQGFALYKDVFRRAKIGLLTHPGPGKMGFFPEMSVNESAYSQLLYAVCLDLLRDAFQHETSWSASFLQRSAFAVFTLYALFSTNPLPQCPGHETTASATQCPHFAPLGLNIKRQQRRYFAPRIRIDIKHYSYLLQLLDIVPSLTSTSSSLRALAVDVKALVQRMVQQSNVVFDFCAYTGPCGIEAWAAHSNRSSSTENPVTRVPAEQQEQPAQENNDDDDDDESSLPESLTPQYWKTYYEQHRAAIRLPPPNGTRQSNRIRDTLQQLFRDPIPTAPWIEPTAEEPEDTEPTDEAPASEQQQWLAQATQLHIPPNATSLQKASLLAAMESLYERNIPLFPLPPPPVQQNEEQSATIETHASPSVAGTSVGRRALDGLLQQAQQTARGDFLQTHQESLDYEQPQSKKHRGKRKDDPSDDDVSELSFDGTTGEQDDQSLATASQVGKLTLDRLLRAARSRQDTPIVRASRAGRNVRAASRENQEDDQTIATVSQAGRMARTRRGEEQDDPSIATASQGGRMALDQLLRAAGSRKGQGAREDPSVARTYEREMIAPDRSRHAHGREQDDQSIATASQSGKVALDDLLRAAGRRRGRRDQGDQSGRAARKRASNRSSPSDGTRRGKACRDDQSVATHSEGGKKPPRSNGPKQDDQSIAASSLGGMRALDQLLRAAGNRQDSGDQDDQSTTLASDGGKRIPDHPSRCSGAGEDDQSIATEGGKRALDQLLRAARSRQGNGDQNDPVVGKVSERRKGVWLASGEEQDDQSITRASQGRKATLRRPAGDAGGKERKRKASIQAEKDVSVPRRTMPPADREPDGADTTTDDQASRTTDEERNGIGGDSRNTLQDDQSIAATSEGGKRALDQLLAAAGGRDKKRKAHTRSQKEPPAPRQRRRSAVHEPPIKGPFVDAADSSTDDQAPQTPDEGLDDNEDDKG